MLSLKSLVQLLEHPQGVSVCEKMLSSSRSADHVSKQSLANGEGTEKMCATCYAGDVADQGKALKRVICGLERLHRHVHGGLFFECFSV